MAIQATKSYIAQKIVVSTIALPLSSWNNFTSSQISAADVARISSDQPMRILTTGQTPTSQFGDGGPGSTAFLIEGNGEIQDLIIISDFTAVAVANVTIVLGAMRPPQPA